MVGIVAAFAAVVSLAGCGTGGQGGAAGQGEGRLAVVATTTQLADFARNVGGDRVQVTGLLKANVDAHDYEPSAADIDAIARAGVLVENGVGLESWLAEVIEASGFDGERVDASTGVRLLAGEGEHAEPAGAGAPGADEPMDPHIWQSPVNAKLMVANIERAFIKADAEGAATYRANAERYTEALDRLDADVAARIAALPNKKLVTNHDAFHYYVNRYGLEFVGSIIPSFDTSAELSSREVNELVAKIRATGVKAVFSETSLPPETAQTIASEAGVKVVTGEDALYGDSLGPPGSDGATYIDAIRHNTRTIVDNLT
jgi:zinc/manganese transport system substrate-binding protein/manganese/iron transport system substrate-binding protein